MSSAVMTERIAEVSPRVKARMGGFFGLMTCECVDEAPQRKAIDSFASSLSAALAIPEDI